MAKTFLLTLSLTLLILMAVFFFPKSYVSRQKSTPSEVSPTQIPVFSSSTSRQAVSPQHPSITKTSATVGAVMGVEDVEEIEDELASDSDLEELPDFDLSWEF